MPITVRPGTAEDSYAVFRIFVTTISDLGARTGTQGITGGDDPAVLADLWDRRRSLFEHLARSADQFWVAERDGEMIGYARSIVRHSVRELTEFFVLPGHQSAGVGRELLSRVFSRAGVANRSIVATVDTRALARYLKTGVTVRFPICNLARVPEAIPLPATDLTFEPVSESPLTLAAIAAIDAPILGYRRDIDHAWLLNDRQGFLYTRGGKTVGYGYVGYRSGPFALLDAADFPAVLAHAEATAAQQYDLFAVELPMTNHTAIQYLLARGYTLDSFFAFFLTDHPVGTLENYAFTSPPFFV